MHRDRIVSGNASGKALKRSSKESLGGSSNVLRNALAAWTTSRSASGIIAHLQRVLEIAYLLDQNPPRLRFGAGNENFPGFRRENILSWCAVHQTGHIRCQ